MEKLHEAINESWRMKEQSADMNQEKGRSDQKRILEGKEYLKIIRSKLEEIEREIAELRALVTVMEEWEKK